jgi:hypothetical protein
MRGAGTDFHVVGLQQRTAAFGPVALQGEDDVLKGGFHGKYMAFRESGILACLGGSKACLDEHRLAHLCNPDFLVK